MKKYVVIVCTVLMALMIAVTLVPIRDEEEQEGAHLLYVPQGATTKTVGDSLKGNRSIRMKSPLMLTLKVASLVRSIEPGCYEMNGMSAAKFVHNLTSGRQTPVKLTFNNVRTLDELAGRLSKQLMADSAALRAAMTSDTMLNAYGLTKDNVSSMLLPDTYEVYWTVRPDNLMSKLHNAYEAFWQGERDEKAKKMGLTRAEVTTLASIVQEESNLKSEQPRIAALYLNRLKSGMKLQADPTIKFALQDFTLRRIRLEHIKASSESPYNTYTHIGLPPGPIRIADQQTIDAVLNHEDNNYIYMCAKGNGEAGHNFAVTFAEHRKNAALYQKELNERGIK